MEAYKPRRQVRVGNKPWYGRDMGTVPRRTYREAPGAFSIKVTAGRTVNPPDEGVCGALGRLEHLMKLGIGKPEPP